MITDYLPTFNQIEPNLLLGLTAGQVVSQIPAKADIKKTADGKFVENGILCTIDADGKTITNYTTGKALFIHFTEELNTFLDQRKYFAVPYEAGETYLRLVALTPGSEWTTTIEPEDAAYAAAIGDGKVVDLGETTMPDGAAAHKYICVK